MAKMILRFMDQCEVNNDEIEHAFKLRGALEQLQIWRQALMERLFTVLICLYLLGLIVNT